jgi:CHAT domain-containing protein/Tfp pilus assembly protein PilF
MAIVSFLRTNRLPRLVLAGLGLLLSPLGVGAQEPSTASSLPASAPLPNQKVEKNISKRAELRLVLQKPVEHEFRGGGTDTYEIKVKKGRFLRVVAELEGIDATLILTDPSGKVLLEANSPNDDWGPAPASLIVAASGLYHAQVKAKDKNAGAGKYTITVTDLRKPGPKDRTRIAAESALIEANVIGSQSDVDSQQKAMSLSEKASALFHELQDSYGEALSLELLAVMQANIGGLENYTRAINHFNRALPLFHREEKQRDEAQTLLVLGKIYAELGERQKALEYLSQALSLARAVRDQIDEGMTLNRMGRTYRELGEEDKALEYLNQALPVERSVGDRKYEAVAYHNLAGVYSDLGDKQKALEYLNQALPLERAVGDRHGQEVTLNNIGVTYAELGNDQKALEYYNQALPLERVMKDRTGEGTTLNNIGTIYHELGDKQKALEYYGQALQLDRAVGNRPGEGTTLRNIGNIYDELGDKPKALDYYSQALQLDRAVGSRGGEAITLGSMGVTYAGLGEKQAALDSFYQALGLSRAVRNPLTEGRTLFYLMKYWKKENTPGLAIFFGKQSVNAFQQVRRNLQGLDPSLQKSFLESKANVYRDLGDLLIAQGRLLEAQQVLDLLKEQEYFDFVRGGERAVESRSKPISLNPEEQSSHEAYEKMAGQITGAGAEFSELRGKRSRTPEEEARMSELKEKLTVANQEMGRFFKTLYVEFGKNAQANQSAENVREAASGMQSIVRELGPGTVALYTLVGETRYSVIVITGSTMQARAYAIEAADLRKKVAAFLEALKNPASDPLPASQELYKILFAPIVQDLKGAKAQTLMWSLNDVLRYVPMGALHDGKQYLVEDYRNVVITPASIGRLKDKVDVSDSSIAGMGVSKDYDGLGALAAVPAELRHIVRDKQVQGATGVIPGTMMLDDDFTEAHMAEALDKHYPVVHIASHFVLQTGNETNSYLLLGGKDVGGKGYHLTLAELRDDPALTFEGTELLTLSACQTGTSGTALNGREVDGLGITAQQKGAKAVLASLWSVADESTALLMADFYRQWLGTPGTTKVAALQQAQLDMLHGAAKTDQSSEASANNTKNAAEKKPAASFAHPFYWAPFILIGNWK